MKQNIQIFIKCGEDSTDNLVKVNGEYLLIAEYDFQEGHGAEIINEYGETIVPMEYYDINSQCGMNRLVVENSEGYYGAIDLKVIWKYHVNMMN